MGGWATRVRIRAPYPEMVSGASSSAANASGGGGSGGRKAQRGERAGRCMARWRRARDHPSCSYLHPEQGGAVIGRWRGREQVLERRARVERRVDERHGAVQRGRSRRLASAAGGAGVGKTRRSSETGMNASVLLFLSGRRACAHSSELATDVDGAETGRGHARCRRHFSQVRG